MTKSPWKGIVKRVSALLRADPEVKAHRSRGVENFDLYRWFMRIGVVSLIDTEDLLNSRHNDVVTNCRLLEGALPKNLSIDSTESIPLVAEEARYLLAEAFRAEDSQTRIRSLGWCHQHLLEDERRAFSGRITGEALPVATQIFTPRWIARYLVDNTLGLHRRSGETSPRYLLDADPPRLEKSLDQITIFDPACGTGHLLLEAYDLLRAEAPGDGESLEQALRRILGRQLFGVDLCPKVVALARFLLRVRAAQDIPALLLDDTLAINIFDLSGEHLSQGTIRGASDPESNRHRVDFASFAARFGSLVRPAKGVAPRADDFRVSEPNPMTIRDSRASAVSVDAMACLEREFDVVLANPPYLGRRAMDDSLRLFAKENFPNSKEDLFSMFIERILEMMTPGGSAGIVTVESWMFLPSFAGLRAHLRRSVSFESIVHLDKGLLGIAFGTSAFVVRRDRQTRPVRFVWCEPKDLGAAGEPNTFPPQNSRNAALSRSDGGAIALENFDDLPGSTFSYWSSKSLRESFRRGMPLGDLAPVRQGLATGDNERFLRRWHEVPRDQIGFGMKNREEAQSSGRRWFPYNKGGPFRNWSGNSIYVVDWKDDGKAIRTLEGANGRIRSRPQNTDYYFRPGITWTFLSATRFGVRLTEPGFIFDVAGSTLFPAPGKEFLILAFLASPVARELLRIVNPTVNFQVGNIASLPLLETELAPFVDRVTGNARECVRLAAADWSEFESSWQFQSSPLLDFSSLPLADRYTAWANKCRMRRECLAQLEEENSEIFANAYDFHADRGDVEGACGESARCPTPRAAAIEFVSFMVGVLVGRFAASSSCGSLSQRIWRSTASEVLALHDDGERTFVSSLREFLDSQLCSASCEGDLLWLATMLAPAIADPSKGIVHYMMNYFFADHLRMYGGRPLYVPIGTDDGSFQWLVYLHGLTSESAASFISTELLPLRRYESRKQDGPRGITRLAALDRLIDEVRCNSSVFEPATDGDTRKTVARIRSLVPTPFRAMLAP